MAGEEESQNAVANADCDMTGRDLIKSPFSSGPLMADEILGDAQPPEGIHLVGVGD